MQMKPFVARKVLKVRVIGTRTWSIFLWFPVWTKTFSYFYFSDRLKEKTYQIVLKFFFSFKEPILFSSSVADNIAYGAATGQQVSQDDIEDAAVQANAYSFIKSFPKGFDTVVGERGQMLSGYIHRIGLNSSQATTSK